MTRFMKLLGNHHIITSHFKTMHTSTIYKYSPSNSLPGRWNTCCTCWSPHQNISFVQNSNTTADFRFI